MLETYKEFWIFYLNENSNPATRKMHVFGTILGLIILGCAIFYHSWNLVLLALVVGYGFAWVSHFFIEKNRPATFKYPWKSFWADMKLLVMTITGEIEEEIELMKKGENLNKESTFH